MDLHRDRAPFDAEQRGSAHGSEHDDLHSIGRPVPHGIW